MKFSSKQPDNNVMVMTSVDPLIIFLSNGIKRYYEKSRNQPSADHTSLLHMRGEIEVNIIYGNHVPRAKSVVPRAKITRRQVTDAPAKAKRRIRAR